MRVGGTLITLGAPRHGRCFERIRAKPISRERRSGDEGFDEVAARCRKRRTGGLRDRGATIGALMRLAASFQ